MLSAVVKEVCVCLHIHYKASVWLGHQHEKFQALTFDNGFTHRFLLPDRSLETRLSQTQTEMAGIKQDLTAAQQTKISMHAELVAAQEECTHLRWAA